MMSVIQWMIFWKIIEYKYKIGGDILALSKQIHLYSVDTDCFYNDNEKFIHRRLNSRYYYRTKLNSKRGKIQRRLDKANKKQFDNFFMNNNMLDELKTIGRRITILDNEVRELKKELKALLSENTNQRSIRITQLKSRDVVSSFDSSLIRYIGLPYDKLTHDMLIVKTYYFDVLKDIIKNGFMFGKDEFIPFTASAGQIRTKKTLFIKKSTHEKVKENITCGLTPDIINTKGGVNINKYLAYLALSNSATEEWHNFDISKSIVVKDLETMVSGVVDFIDRDDYSITRQQMDVPVPHSDGCGMMLKSVNNKAMMVRLPWVKGLLIPFPFDKFIREHNRANPNNKIGEVEDIYGDTHNILEDGIEIIFTESQFKMYKYYQDWAEYQKLYIKHNCQAGYCNEEPDNFGDAKLNYQMLQTLDDMTKDELKELATTTIEDIKKIGSDKATMLKILGVTPSNINKNKFQQSLEVYPELLRDKYSKQVIKQTKKSMIDRARSGRLNIRNSKYTFISPDMYAFCEFLFLGIEKPKGILQDGEVSCRLYDDKTDLDCLRSPHLYKEHAVRKNHNNDLTKKWFSSQALYISSHDLISKILQCDFDGDTALVIDNELFVEIAKRNMEGIVPLYYKMKGADPHQINSDTIYTGLENAYKGGNIGMISNNITKIWNRKNPDLNIVKLLCLENNFTIDYAKTLFKPERPPKLKKSMSKCTSGKLPYFFIYAKDKKRHQVEARNESTVNMIKSIIPKHHIDFRKSNVGKFDYKLLMSDSSIKIKHINNGIIDLYTELDLHKYFMINYVDEKENNLTYMYQEMREKLLEVEQDIDIVVDTLVGFLYKYKKSSYKISLWECFGDVLVDNLKNNINQPLDNGWMQCEVCGDRIPYYNNRLYCEICQNEENKKNTKFRMKNIRKMFEAEEFV